MTTLDLDPVPYNISLTDQSAIVRFFPHRDGTIDGSWNVTYSGSSFADWSYDHTLGAGTSSHRTTLAGAYVVIDWAGTAVWLYGTAAADSYNVRIDQSSVVQGGGADIDGLLFSETGLAYGLHTVNLTVTAGEVSIIGATITVGMGESGTVLQPRNISATENSTPAMTENPFFVGDQSWSVMDLYTNQTSGYPSLVTSTFSSTLSFTLSEAVGFFIYGSDDWVQGLFTVAVTSDDEGATNSVTDNTIQYSPRALWTQLDLPKYMATGLNRSATYQVEITNLGAQFHFASVVAYDAVPSASASPSAVGGSGSLPSQTFGAGTTNTSATPSSSAQAIASISHTKSPTWAIITGAVLGCVVAALLILAIVIWFRRVLRRRHQRKEEVLTTPNPFGDGIVQSAPASSTIPALTTAARGPRKFASDGPRAWGPSTTVPVSNTSRMGETQTTTLVLRPRDSNLYETIGSQIHERDAGPATQPPLYDPSWAI